MADVDLYIPIKESILEKFYDKLTPGGLIMVDDVKNASCWDGAHQAYHEFCDKKYLAKHYWTEVVLLRSQFNYKISPNEIGV